MASKTISLKEETYERLRRKKGDDESFNDLMHRVLDEEEHPLYGLIGLAEEDEIDRIQDGAQSSRAEIDSRISSNGRTEQRFVTPVS